LQRRKVDEIQEEVLLDCLNFEAHMQAKLLRLVFSPTNKGGCLRG